MSTQCGLITFLDLKNAFSLEVFLSCFWNNEDPGRTWGLEGETLLKCAAGVRFKLPLVGALSCSQAQGTE